MERLYACSLDTPIGKLTLVEENGALTNIFFQEDALPAGMKARLTGEGTSLLEEASRQLLAYFAGERQAFSLPLEPRGTPFQRRVWAVLQTIPYGETRSYKEVAVLADCPKGYRAVGLANNRNPIPILIPCHRVIGSDGDMTGYAGGLATKEYLLKRECV